MKRILTPMIIALLAGPGAPGALAQGDADAPDPPTTQRDRGDAPRGEGGDRPPGERGDRPQRPDRGPHGERGERDERGEPGDHDWQLAVDDLDDAIGFIERMNPRLAASLRETQQDSPEQAVRRIAEEAPRTYELLRMRAQEPERFALHLRSMQLMRDTRPLIHQLRQAQRDEDQPKVDELTVQVREAVEAFYEVRMALRELDIQELKDELEALEADHAEDQARREEHIERRLEDILNSRYGRRRGEPGERGERGEPGPRGDGPPDGPPDARRGDGPRDR